MFERTRVRPDGLKVDTVIDFQNEEKEKFFTDLYEWLESITSPDVEVTHSSVWSERKSFACYTGDFYELPNNDGWDRCDCTLSSIRLQRVHWNYEASIDVLLFPLYARAKRYGIESVKNELLNEPIIRCMLKDPKNSNICNYLGVNHNEQVD